MTDSVSVERQDGVVSVVLNRPERMNALIRPMWPLLTGAFADLSADESVRCIILRGAGKSFSPGADISEFESERADPGQAAAYGRTMDAAYDAIRGCPHPVIAAIRGPCTGAGLVLALLCDLRISSESGRFGAPVSRIGLAMPYPEFSVLFQALGRARTLALLLEARVVDAAEALDLGIVARVVPDKELDRAVADSAARIAAGAPLVNRAHKRFAVRLASGEALDAAEIAAGYESFGTEDYREGYRAFLEKRKPDFQGR